MDVGQDQSCNQTRVKGQDIGRWTAFKMLERMINTGQHAGHWTGGYC